MNLLPSAAPLAHRPAKRLIPRREIIAHQPQGAVMGKRFLVAQVGPAAGNVRIESIRNGSALLARRTR